MEIIDTHIHLWDLGRLTYSWLQAVDPAEAAVLGNYDAVRKNYLVEDYLQEIRNSGVTKAVHVQAAVGHPDPVEETAWLQAIADARGLPQAIIGFCNLCEGSVDAVLDGHQQYANFRGIRMLGTRGKLLDGRFLEGFSRVAKRGLVYDLEASLGDYRAAAKLARRFPNTSIVLEHTGMPMERTAEYFQAWRTELSAFAAVDNVVCKISGLGMTDHKWTVASIRPWVEVCIELFGVKRCMFGTNWPVDSLYGTFEAVVSAFREIVHRLSEDERRQILCGTAEATYRI
jgi:predicted TIM-barrel fold metal-dependent hydrolase